MLTLPQPLCMPTTPRFLRLFRLRFHASGEDAEDLPRQRSRKSSPCDGCHLIQRPGAYLWSAELRSDQCADTIPRLKRWRHRWNWATLHASASASTTRSHSSPAIAVATRFARDHSRRRAAALTLLVVEQWNGTELAAICRLL
ncbi:MAG: hypothetical protein R3E84_21365 [Pseudomonadales bacterium]